MAMDRYLLDTDMCIFWLRGNPRAKQKISEAAWDSLAICPITMAELYVGAYGSATPIEHLAQIDAFVRLLRIAPLSDAALRRFGELKVQLKRANRLVADFDLLIASMALANGLTLVTNNRQHYQRVPGLKIENWMAAQPPTGGAGGPERGG